MEPERTGTPFRFIFGRTVVQNLGLLALLLSSHETDVVDVVRNRLSSFDYNEM